MRGRSPSRWDELNLPAARGDPRRRAGGGRRHRPNRGRRGIRGLLRYRPLFGRAIRDAVVDRGDLMAVRRAGPAFAIGLHAGEAHCERRPAAGSTSAGPPASRRRPRRQIVLGPVRALVGGLAPGVVLHLGRHQLKDVPQPERLYQLDAPGLRTISAPRTSAPTTGNLPAHGFVGRESGSWSRSGSSCATPGSCPSVVPAGIGARRARNRGSAAPGRPVLGRRLVRAPRLHR